MSETKTKLMIDGVTTQFDVAKLLEAFPTKEGDILDHDSIASAFGGKAKTNRYRSVVGAWRKALVKERNVDIESIPGVGYRVLRNAERIKAAATGMKRGARSIGNAVKILDRTEAERLDTQERATFDHVSRIAKEVAIATNKARKVIAVRIGEFQSNPRPVLTEG